MHLSHPDRRGGRRASAFTLLELLVVITIIAILAALTLGATKFAKNKAAASKTQGMIKMIELALEKYQLEYGEYPSGVTEALEDGVDAAGAKMLYQLITGDGTDSLVTTGGTPSDGDIGIDENPIIDNGFSGKSDKYGFTRTIGANKYILADGWGNPIQYRHPADAAGYGWTMRNGTYDLFSYGTDDEYSEAEEVKWVKNW